MSKVSKVKRKKSKGFTLIELLVVVAIVGILAAIAIPQFAAYRARGFNARVQSDLRNAATAQEAYFVDEDGYADCTSPCSELPGFNQSDGVTMTCTAVPGPPETFQCTASHPNASITSCTWTSGGPNNLVCT